MSAFLPTTTVRVERGEGVDEYGDPVDFPATVRTAVPVAVSETRQRKFQPTDQRDTLVEEYVIRARPGFVYKEGDRLIDERTGIVYRVQQVAVSPALIGASDSRLSAVRIGSTSGP